MPRIAQRLAMSLAAPLLGRGWGEVGEDVGGEDDDVCETILYSRGVVVVRWLWRWRVPEMVGGSKQKMLFFPCFFLVLGERFPSERRCG